MSKEEFLSTGVDRLATFLQMSEGDDLVWGPQELGAIFRHQLTAPIEYDLGRLPRGDARRLKLLASSTGLLLKSFGDLFQHSNPPLELLKLTKQFAKANRQQPDSPLPPEITTLLYYCSIAAAMVRCRQRITQLSDEVLREGFTWGRDLEWVDDATRTLFKEALTLLGKDAQP